MNRRVIIVLMVFIIQLILNEYLSFSLYFIPSMFLLFVAILPFDYNPLKLLLSSFGIGLLFDILTNGVPGLYAGGATIAAFSRLLILPGIVNLDAFTKYETPSIKNMGLPKYFLFLLTIFSLFNIFFIIFDGVKIAGFMLIAIRFLLSTLINATLVLLIMVIFDKKRY